MSSDRWNTALWGVSRWPALSLADLMQQPPVTGRGIPTGVGDWRLSVEALLPADALAVWGIGTWGDVEWSPFNWVDLTPWVRGAEWSRGADEAYGRPRVGRLAVTLDATGDRFSPWNRDGAAGESIGYFAPGTVIRVGVRSNTDNRADGWLPQITAITDSWGIAYVGRRGADRYVDVVGYETVGDLATIDDNALPSPVGSGEPAADRFARLLDAAEWPYGLIIAADNVAGGGYTMQSTQMTANRLTELYLTADSCDAYFRSDRTGAAIVANVEYATTPPSPTVDRLYPFSFTTNTGIVGFQNNETVINDIVYAPIDPNRFATANDKANIVNDARFARAGGTQQVHEQFASISRHGRRTLVRNDFLLTSDAAVLLIAQYVTIRRALNTIRVEQLDVDTLARNELTNLSMMAVDVGQRCIVAPPAGTPPPAPAPVITAFVRSMSHRIEPGADRLNRWDTSFSFDTRTVFNIPGAQLPETPL